MDKARFSPSGEFLSVCGSDGRLRIWDTKGKSSCLKQEFVPSAHLSATCTCIEWAPSSSTSNAKNGAQDKRKRKKRCFEGDLVAMGTADGSLLLYSVAKSQLLAHSKQAHSGPITGLTWNLNTLSLYSCGEDGFIVEWDAENAKSLSRWKGGKGPLSCISIFKDMLLSSGRGITLWNLETKTSVMNFMGQPSTVSQIQQIPNTDYFVTMSLKETHLQIWSKSEQSAVATLMLMENPRQFCVVSPSGGKVSVSAVTENGTLCTFSHKLNGPLRKPLAPTCILTVMDAHEPTTVVPVLSCFLTNEDESSAEVKIAYGSWSKLQFDSMAVKYLQDKVTIKREFVLKSKVSKHKQKQKDTDIETDVMTEVPSDAKHLQPGSDIGLIKPLDGKGKKRKKNQGSNKDEEELPMEDRLSNLTIDAPSSGGIPDGNNLAHLLSQGLHSKDAKILQSVLSRWDQDAIDNSIRSLPVQMIVPLLNEIKKMVSNKPMLNHSVIKWLKAIFKVHSAFLMSCPSSEDMLGPFISLLHSREILYPQMCQLKGKLELIKGNIESKEHKTEIPNEALLVYHDESSEDGEDEDMIPSESEEFFGSDDLVEDDSESDDSGDEQMGSGGGDGDDTDSGSSDDEQTVSKTPVSKMNGGNESDSMEDDE
ncbi:WD repeat-containing protein 43 [Folsomia candida]|nr:WD repeat-containing protein 43 [Folsomia candida]